MKEPKSSRHIPEPSPTPFFYQFAVIGGIQHAAAHGEDAALCTLVEYPLISLDGRSEWQFNGYIRTTASSAVSGPNVSSAVSGATSALDMAVAGLPAGIGVKKALAQLRAKKPMLIFKHREVRAALAARVSTQHAGSELGSEQADAVDAPASTEAAHGAATDDWLSGLAASAHVESPVWACIVRQAARLASAPRLILDLASGPGEPACSLAARFPSARITCSDSDPRMLSAARARVAALGIGKRLTVSLLDMTDLSSVASGSFDLVTISLGLYLVPDDLPATLAAVARVLKPGGHCIATVWAPS
jgi:predicted O-methyltransferase YrrM